MGDTLSMAVSAAVASVGEHRLTRAAAEASVSKGWTLQSVCCCDRDCDCDCVFVVIVSEEAAIREREREGGIR